MISKFLRYCKLSFFDNNEQVLYTLEGGGLPGMARIAFDIEREKDGINTIAEIKVFNLINDTATKIKKSIKISLEVGYKGESSEIFYGTVAKVITKRFIDSEGIFYCVSGKLELDKKTTIALGAGSMLKSIFLEVDKALCNTFELSNDGEMKILHNTEIFGDYLNKIYLNGYVVVNSIKNVLNQITRSYPDVEWVFDDNKVYFFNPKNKTKSVMDFTIQSGVNLIAADYSSRERDFREKYFRERTAGQKQSFGKFSKKEDIDTITVSCLMDKDLSMIKNIRLVNSDEQVSVHVIKSIRYIGDTHQNGDNWKIDLELYDNN